MFSGAEDKRPNITQGVSMALITQEIPRVFGSCEPGTVDEDHIYMKNIFWSSK